MDEPAHHLIMADLCHLGDRVRDAVVAAQDRERCLVYAWAPEPDPRLRRCELVPADTFRTQTAAFMLGRALEALAAEVPAGWRGEQSVVVIAPRRLFSKTLFSILAERYVSSLVTLHDPERICEFLA